MNVNEKLNKLRKLMDERGIDIYIEPSADPHGSEYLADHFQTRAYITGFTGSAGTALVTGREAILWTDGRYFIQAENQLRDNEFELYKMNTPGFPSLNEWLSGNVTKETTIGFNGEVFSQGAVENIQENLDTGEVKFKDGEDLVGMVWGDRPELPVQEAFLIGEEFSGRATDSKIMDVRHELEKKKATHLVLGSLDDIAWLYNIRGWDVKNNPVVISYALVSEKEALLFTDEKKITLEVREALGKAGVEVQPYHNIFHVLSGLGSDARLLLDKNKINRSLFKSIPKTCKVLDSENITTYMKGRKNQVEIRNQKEAYLKDGVALTRFFHWLDQVIGVEMVTEITASEKLLDFRKEQEGFLQPSFGTISAYGPNGAMMHYSPSERDCATLEKKGFYLVDSGGQYYNGTTDITRTVGLGEMSQEEKRDFTLVLKGHINLISSKFLQGTSGHVLDILARQPLWNQGIDYKSGTGHGVGYLLNVHEGPHRIATVPNNVAMESGMVVTVEPGIYREGKHGIRIENVAVVQEDVNTESGQFLSFDVLSYCHIDRDCIISEMLSDHERTWLNSYNKAVYENLRDRLDKGTRDWLWEKTQPIEGD